MSNLSVIIRKDLSMPRGKMGAQAAHSAMRLFLGGLMPNGIPFQRSLPVSRVEEFKRWLSEGDIALQMVKGEEALHAALPSDQPMAIIIDNGRTHFNGQKTLTCAAYGLFSTGGEGLSPDMEQDRVEKARQYFVLSDEFNVDKESVCKLTIRSCLEDMFLHMDREPSGNYTLHLPPETARADWLSGAFTKICLRAESDEQLQSKADDLQALGFSISRAQVGPHKGFCVEPSYSEVIRPVLDDLRPLMGW
jgi:peptidyl-tRNA hydrolase